MHEYVAPLISTDLLGVLLKESAAVVVDARGGADAFDRYRSGHLKGAVFVDLETDLSHKEDAAQGGRHPLPHPQRFGSLLGKLGISPSDHLLVYDDKAGANAASRFWWMMRAAGHQKIQVIDGGFSAIVRAGLPVSIDSPPAVPLKHYPLHSWNLPTASIETVDRSRTQTDFLVVDVREPYRFRGESEPIDLVAGHIPGAVNLSYLDNLQSDGTFRAAEILAEQFRRIVGERDIAKVIVHCGSGVTACHTLLAMERAGFGGASLYVGSWSEWSRNDKPIAKSTETGDFR